MNASSPLPKDDPRIIAWEAHKKTEDFANTLRWVHTAPGNTIGSLWSVFLVGYEAGAKTSLNDAHPGDELIKTLEDAVDKFEGKPSASGCDGTPPADDIARETAENGEIVSIAPREPGH